MPELPEVETIKRSLRVHLIGAKIQNTIIRVPKLRWPISPGLNARLHHQSIQDISRRGKYLLFHLDRGALIIHLGMSGTLRLFDSNLTLKPHDHVDILLSCGKQLRYNDPRRFGAILWSAEPFQHPLLQSIGIEPLDPQLTGAFLQNLLSNTRTAIKIAIMNSKIIAGIGNIYATEALFLSSIHPLKPANQLSPLECNTLVNAIQTVLQKAIQAGGTTLKDYVNSEGKPGYFSQELDAYGRAGLPCKRCDEPLKNIQLGQRATVYCESCQRITSFCLNHKWS